MFTWPLKLQACCMAVVLQVKEIRNKMFHSANFKLTNTEMKDHFKTMTTLLEDPTQLKNDGNAKTAVQQLQQVTQNRYKWGICQVAKVKCIAAFKNTMQVCNDVYNGYIYLSQIYLV